MAGANRPIRVVHVVRSTFGRHFSGQTRWLYTLLSGWQDPDVTLGLWGTELKPVNMNSGNLKYQLPEGSRLWTGGRILGRLGLLWSAVRRLTSFVFRRNEFDIAHFHTLSWFELLSPVVLHRLGKKAVYTTSLYESDNPGEIAKRRGALGLDLYRRFDGVIALSPGLTDDCREHGITNVLCLPNFLVMSDLEAGRNESLRAAMRARYRIPPDDRVLLFAGSATRRKGLDTLVESYIRVAQQYPRTWLLLVGANDKTAAPRFDVSYVAEQRRKLHEARISDRVIWTGLVADERELVGYYSAADIFVFLTRMEGLGNVLVEAAAAGLPTVATNLPGITDAVVTEGETGFLVPADDVGEATRAVGRLIADPSLHAKMSAAARDRARLFGFESYCHRLKDFYLSVMGIKTEEPKESEL